MSQKLAEFTILTIFDNSLKKHTPKGSCKFEGQILNWLALIRLPMPNGEYIVTLEMQLSVYAPVAVRFLQASPKRPEMLRGWINDFKFF